MKISEILKPNRVSFSLEVFPPKIGSEIDKMDDILDSLAELHPDFISVTCGASGSTARTTPAVCQKILDRGMTPLAHMTCVSASREGIADCANQLHDMGVENILALRGDIPEVPVVSDSERYTYASDLVAALMEDGRFCVGGACYPDGHVEAANKDSDLDALKIKADAGCSFLTTQMFFDNDVLYSFMYRALRKDIRVPILAGIMPATNARQFARSCQLSGTAMPPRLRSILDKFGDNPAAMRQAAIVYASEQIIDLVANGVQGIHLYTMNRPAIAAAILKNVKSVLGR